MQTYKQHLCIGPALLLLPGVDAEVRDGQIRAGIHLPSVLLMLQWKIHHRIRGRLQKCVGTNENNKHTSIHTSFISFRAAVYTHQHYTSSILAYIFKATEDGSIFSTNSSKKVPKVY
jgi:hypothetical protein